MPIAVESPTCTPISPAREEVSFATKAPRTGKAFDVLNLAQAAHMTLEYLFRAMRNNPNDRAALLGQLAPFLVAHLIAEEQAFHATQSCNRTLLASNDKRTKSLQALLDLSECPDAPDSSAWESKLYTLIEAVMGHVYHMERDVLSIVRKNLHKESREREGDTYVEWRDQMIGEESCGSAEYVKTLLADRAVLY